MRIMMHTHDQMDGYTKNKKNKIKNKEKEIWNGFKKIM